MVYGCGGGFVGMAHVVTKDVVACQGRHLIGESVPERGRDIGLGLT